VAGSAGPLVFGQYNLALLGIYLSVPLLSASIIWLAYRKKNSIISQAFKHLNSVSLLALLLLFLFSVLTLHFLPVRTVSYYVMIAIMGAAIFVQVMHPDKIDKKLCGIILLQIVMLFLNIIWGVTFKYYFFIGRTDILFHSWVIENLLSAGYINQTFDIYDAFPLWHILCSFIYQMTGLQIMPAKVMFLTNGLIYGCLVLVVYLAASKLFNKKAALMSSLFLCFNTDAIFYGMYSIPRSVIFFLEGLLLILLLQKRTLISLSVIILIIIGLIMYHTASMPFIIMILFMLYVLQRVYCDDYSEKIVNFNFLLLIFVLTAAYWMYAGTKVFMSVFGNLLGEAPSGVLTKSIVVTPLQELFNYLQYSPLLLFVILGVLWGLRESELKSSAKIYLLISLN
jgi:hypothetical protein